VAFVFFQEFNVSDDDRSTTNYDKVSERLDVASNPPAGLIVHTAGWDEENGTFRIFDVWESRQDFDRFFTERLEPALNELMPQFEDANASPPDREGKYETHDVAKG
jgi:hypothetical protein